MKNINKIINCVIATAALITGALAKEVVPMTKSNWIGAAQTLSVKDGVVTVDGMLKTSTFLHLRKAVKNFELEVDIEILKSKEATHWASVVFHADKVKGNKSPWNQMTVRTNTALKNGVAIASFNKKWAILETGRTKKTDIAKKHFKLRVQDSIVKVYVDGVIVLNESFLMSSQSGSIGLSASGCVAQFSGLKILDLPDTKELKERDKKLKPMKLIAHRGYSKVAPENTGSSLKKSIEANADLCEFDVLISRDKRVVLMHDSTVNRTTDGQGRVADLTLADLQKLDAGEWRGKQFKGEPILTLEQALKLFEKTKTVPVIEIKAPAASNEVIRILKGSNQRAVVIAFSEQVVKHFSTMAPTVQCAWICSRFPANCVSDKSRIDYLSMQCRKLGIKAIDLNFNMLSPSVINALQSQGVAVWTWTVNDPKVANLLESWGLDALTTDSLLERAK